MGLFKNAFKGLVASGEAKVSGLVKKHVTVAKNGMTGFKAGITSAVTSHLPVTSSGIPSNLKDITGAAKGFGKGLKSAAKAKVHGLEAQASAQIQAAAHKGVGWSKAGALTAPVIKGGLSRSRALHSTGSSTTIAEKREVASGGTLTSDIPPPYTPWDHPLMAAPRERWELKGLV